AMRTLVNTVPIFTGVTGQRARTALAGTRFGDVRWVAETGSTNVDLMDLARDGQPEGVVLVADHQSSGQGRHGRVWTAPPGASLLVSVLLRPPAAVAAVTTMAGGVAMVAALEEVAGLMARLKWPNDLVWPGDGTVTDRKLGGILAEADWPAGSNISAGWREPGPAERVVVVAGVGVNVNWPAELPQELADLAVAVDHVTGQHTDREDLLISFLRNLDRRYGQLVATRDRQPLLDEWRERSATLGRRVRVDLGSDDIEGLAADVTDEGHLVIETLEGTRRTVAVGDIVHLRPG
ncbi:MAG: biotin--[acetyl-CoA-carboxylase] ligase, partial [Acidimicrobiales bacterium]